MVSKPSSEVIGLALKWFQTIDLVERDAGRARAGLDWLTQQREARRRAEEEEERVEREKRAALVQRLQAQRQQETAVSQLQEAGVWEEFLAKGQQAAAVEMQVESGFRWLDEFMKQRRSEAALAQAQAWERGKEEAKKEARKWAEKWITYEAKQKGLSQKDFDPFEWEGMVAKRARQFYYYGIPDFAKEAVKPEALEPKKSEALVYKGKEEIPVTMPSREEQRAELRAKYRKPELGVEEKPFKPWLVALYEKYPRNPIFESLMYFNAGCGDTFVNLGSTANWLGNEGIGQALKDFGGKSTVQVPDPGLEEVGFRKALNPRYYITDLPRAVPFTLSLVPAMIIGAYGGAGIATTLGLGMLGKFILASMAGAALSRPLESAMEAGEAYERATSSGIGDEEADKIADEVFRKNLVLVGLDAAQIAAAFAPTPAGKIASNIFLKTMVIGGKVVIVGLSEAGEEAYQDIIHRQAAGEEIRLDPRMQEAMLLGGIMGMGMGGVGSVYNSLVNKTRSALTASEKSDFDNNVARFIKEGLNEDVATLRALDELAQTKRGQEILAEVIDRVKKEEIKKQEAAIPTTLAVNEKAETKIRAEAEEVTPVAPEVAKEVIPTMAEITKPVIEITKIKKDLITELNRRAEAGEKLPVGVTRETIIKHIEGMSERLLRDWHGTIFKLEVAPEVTKPVTGLEVETKAAAEFETVTGEIPEGKVVVENLIEPYKKPARVVKEAGGKVATSLRANLTNYVQTHLAKEVRYKLLASIKNVRTEKGFERAIARVNQEVEIHNKRIYAKKISKISYKNLPLDYKTKFRNILLGFDLKFRTNRTLNKRGAMRDYLNRLEETDGIVTDISDEYLEMINKIPLRDMTSEQLGMVYDELARLAHLGSLKNKLLLKQARRKVEAVVDNLVGTLGEVKVERPAVTLEAKRKTARQLIVDKAAGFTARTWRVERILRRMDNYVEGGEFTRAIWQPIQQATDQKLKGIYGTLQEFRAFLQASDINLHELLKQKEDIDGVRLTASEKIGIYLGSLNRDNRFHMIYGNGWSEEFIDKVSDSLTANELKVAGWLKSYFKKQGPIISKVRTQVEGKPLTVTENYFPIRIDSEADIDFNFDRRLNAEDLLRFTARWASVGVSKGFLRERLRGARQAVKVDALAMFLNHLDGTEHYKAFAPTIQELQRVLSNHKLRHTIIQRQGKATYEVLDKWLKQVAETNALRVDSFSERALKILRVNAVTAVLGINIVTAMKQFPSFFNGMAEAGEIAVMKGLFTYIAHPKETHELIKRVAPQIYKRSLEREIAEAKTMRSLEKRLADRMSKREVAMILTTTIDKFVVNSIWRGAFDDFLAKNPGKEDAASEYATGVIQRTQPFFAVKDLAEFWRSGEFMKALTMFTNQLNNNWNYYRHDIFGKWRAGRIGFGQVARKTIDSFVIPGLLIGMFARSRPAEDAGELGKDLIRQALAAIPILGSFLTSGLLGFYSHAGIITTEVFNKLQTFTFHFAKEQWKKALLDIPELAGYVVGIPVTQPKRFVKSLISLAQGKSDDWLALIWGEYVREQAGKINVEKAKGEFLKEH